MQLYSLILYSIEVLSIVVLLRSTCTWTLFQISHHLLWTDPASTICPQPWDMAGLRVFHDHSHQQNDSFLLFMSQGNLQHCCSTLIWCAEASHYIFCPFKDWLRQFNSGQFTCLSPRATSACHQRSCYNQRKENMTTPLLHDLHWLRICQRIDYKISSLVFKSLLGHVPSYLPFTRSAHITSTLSSID